MTQTRMFALPEIDEGRVTLTAIKKMAMPPELVAELLKQPGAGTGKMLLMRDVKLRIVGFGFKDGQWVWTAAVEDAVLEDA